MYGVKKVNTCFYTQSFMTFNQLTTSTLYKTLIFVLSQKNNTINTISI